MGKKFKDEEVLGPKGMSNIVEMFGTLTPFVSLSFSQSLVQPDRMTDHLSE